MFGLVHMNIKYLNPIIIALSSPRMFNFKCIEVGEWNYLPISFPISQTAVGIDVVCPDFEMIKHNLDLNI